MRLSAIALSFFALVISAGVALARVGTTTTKLGLHAGPSPNTELLLTIPADAKISVGSCSGSWCKVNWNGYSGYAAKSGLAISAGPRVSARTAYPPPGEMIPIFPALSVSRGPLSQGRLVFRHPALHRDQAFVLSPPLLHDVAGAKPLSLHAIHFHGRR